MNTSEYGACDVLISPTPASAVHAEFKPRYILYMYTCAALQALAHIV